MNNNNTPTFKEVREAIEVLRWLRDEIDSGSFDGWGLNRDYVATVKGQLEMLSDGTFGDRLVDD
jgi:hypothetical protein